MYTKSSIINTFVLTILMAFGYSGLFGQLIGECTNGGDNNLTLYNPPLRYLLPKEVNETSGLAWFNGKLWTINDNGGLPVVYGLDTITGKITQRISISNATNHDWESLARDDKFLYIGDFGNNSGNRKDLTIYKVALAGFPLKGDASLTAETITFKYEDYIGSIIKRKDNNFDCEAFIAVDDSLYLFSKNWENQHTRLYRLPKTPGNHTARLLTSFNSKGMITGADIDRATGQILLTGYTNQTWIPFMWLLSDYPGHWFFSGDKRRIDMVNLSATQVEGVVFTQPYKGVITSEGHVFFSQTAFNVSTQNWVRSAPIYVTALSVNNLDFKLSPNPAKGNKVYVEFKNITDGEYSINLFDSKGNILAQPEQSIAEKKENLLRIKLNTKQLEPGTYTVRITCGSQQVEKKLIVQ